MFKPGNDAWTNRVAQEHTCSFCGSVYLTKAPASTLCSPECRKAHVNRYNIERRRNSIEGTLSSIVAGCRSRAGVRGLEYDLTLEYMLDMLKQQEGRCKATGIPLESSQANTKTHSSPWTITVDRIDSNRGYTKDNVQLVCYMYNSAKNRWTHDDVVRMCEGVLKS